MPRSSRKVLWLFSSSNNSGLLFLSLFLNLAWTPFVLRGSEASVWLRRRGRENSRTTPIGKKIIRCQIQAVRAKWPLRSKCLHSPRSRALKIRLALRYCVCVCGVSFLSRWGREITIAAAGLRDDVIPSDSRDNFIALLVTRVHYWR